MNRSELVRHLKDMADDGDVQLREREIATSGGGLVLAHARMTRQDAAVDGYGVAPARDDAIDKALWETVERSCFKFSRFAPEEFKPFRPFRRLIGALTGRHRLHDLKNLGEHSVGCAVHSTRGEAAKAAVHELIERHTVLAAQLMGEPGFKIDGGATRWNGMNLSISHYCWQGPLKTFSVLSEIIHMGDGRVLYSTGLGSTIAAACGKARLEALGHAENFELESRETPDLRLSRGISDLKRWHMLNSGRKAFYRGEKPLTKPPSIDAALNEDRFWTATATLGDGLYFARAYCPDTQNLFVGPWEPERIHPRFRHLWKEGIEPPYAY